MCDLSSDLEGFEWLGCFTKFLRVSRVDRHAVLCFLNVFPVYVITGPRERVANELMVFISV